MENSELNVFKNIKFFSEISNNWPNNSLGTNVAIQDSWILLIYVVNNIEMY